jgi:lysophospholipase L1-like esterase
MTLYDIKGNAITAALGITFKDVDGGWEEYIDANLESNDGAKTMYVIMVVKSKSCTNIGFEGNFIFNAPSVIDYSTTCALRLSVDSSNNPATINFNAYSTVRSKAVSANGDNKFNEVIAPTATGEYWKFIFSFDRFSNTDAVSLMLKDFKITVDGEDYASVKDVVLSCFNPKPTNKVTLVSRQTDVKIASDASSEAYTNEKIASVYDAMEGISSGLAVSKWAGKTVNFLGDSVTSGATYVDALNDIIGFGTVNNYGRIGTTIGGTSSDSFVNRYTGMSNDADLVIVFGGINDFWHGDVTLGNIDDDTNETLYGSLNLLCNGLIDKYPTKTICFMTPLRTSIAAGGLIENMDDVADAVINVCKKFAIPVFDLYNVYGFTPSVKSVVETFYTDTIHPTEAGGQWIAERLAKFLETI